jgi:hypothetical protein
LVAFPLADIRVRDPCTGAPSADVNSPPPSAFQKIPGNALKESLNEAS